ncbi:TonB-dependent receptor [Chitinimonas sp. BJYL2]|uniref:TonB-dependent receptor n=1 Tax=Chitinimonas sp. BJYL2 TaxID=2976696 RepID=UPI0022B5C0EA|nr:TonB-dependent receptor [Chitinimonas sp. BJYL2]
MKNRSADKNTGQLETGFPFQRTGTLVAQSVALAMLGTGMAYAAEVEKAEAITVTGIRGSIEKSILAKKKSNSIVEAVSAEDIGKLPDNSIAESIARLPGLSAQRVAGRAQVISVRGLSPDFATTLLNGREMVSTGDNRSVEFDQYPSELLSAVNIFKTPDAGLVGQGLSGTIDMQTVRPLSYNNRVITGNARWQDSSLGDAGNAKGTGNRLSASYIDQFANRTIGLAIGFAHQETPIQENQVGMYEPWQSIGDGWRPGVAAGTAYSDGIKALRRTGVTKRDGVMATLEVRASDSWTSVVDLFHSKAEQEDTANQIEIHIGGYNGGYNPGLNLTNVSVNSNGSFAGGVASGVYPLVRGMYNKRDDKINAFGWSNTFKLGSSKLVADVSHSKAKRDELSLENNTQLAPAPQLDTLTLKIRSDDFSTMTPGRDYSDPNKLFLRGTIYGSGYGKVPKVEDELTTYKLVATVPAPELLGSWVQDIDLGLNYADRHKMKRQPEGNINVGAQGDTTIASDLQYGLVDLGFAGAGKIPSWNVPGAVARYMTFNPSSTAFDYLVAKSWDVEEQITTGFVKANIDTDLGGVALRGNFGLQVQNTDQSSEAVRLTNGSNPKPVIDGTSYTDVLPSMNLAFDFGNNQMLRVGLAKQVARPRVDQMRSALEFGVGDNPDARDAQGNLTVRTPGASGGNARLEPWRAKAFDMSYEKYFGTKAYVAAAYFYKKLDSYIYTQTLSGYDFSNYVGDAKVIPGTTVSSTGKYTAPTNGKGGSMSGIELSASLPLGMLTDALTGFGVVASASFNRSDIKIDLSQEGDNRGSLGKTSIDLPGLSKRVYNLTAYYENGGFEARVSQRKRSDFIGEIGDFAANRKLRYVVGESIVDAQVGYNFKEGSLKGLGLLLQVNNLGDAAYQTYTATPDRPLEYIKWGRTVLLGASYKY